VRRLILTLVGAVIAFAASAETSLPLEKGLPVVVKAAVSYVEIFSFDENAATFRATVDLRLRWEDLRLRRPAEEAKDPPRVFRGADADAEVRKIWVTDIAIGNQVGSDAAPELGLRIFPDGRVELMRRITGDFSTAYDVSRFPFGKQQLQVRLVVRDLTANQLNLAFDQDDLDFSRPAANAALDGWDLRFVNLKVEPLTGWYGGAHATLTAALEITRQPGPTIAAIFVPLLASLLIPLLTIWLNRAEEDGTFNVEAYELVNIIIGGLFAVIALNFTVNSVFEVLESGDNPVNRLFTLNYITLAACLAVNVLLGRFGVVAGLFGNYVQEQLYHFLMWAIPAMVLLTAASIILVAVA
jgi:hypothetical protein